jgi:hypothetical protein
MSAHTKGCQGNLLAGTQIQSLRMVDPSMGFRACQLLATLCVAMSLVLFAQGSTDLTGGFCLQTLSYSKPTAIMGPILDTVIISCSVVGTSCEEYVRQVNLGLLCMQGPHHFASSVITPWGYKAGDCPCTHLHPLAITLITSFSVLQKREIDRSRNKGKFLGRRERCFSILSNYGRT